MTKTKYTERERNLARLICAIAASYPAPIGYGDVVNELLGFENEGPSVQRANFLAIYALDHVRGLHGVKMDCVKPRHHAEAAQLLDEGWTDE